MRGLARWVVLGLAVGAAGDIRGQAPEPEARSGAVLYQDACAACHGVDGRGAAPSQVAFDLPLPDFTDCGFATREPDTDWIAVTHDGGPARGFDRLMPAFGQALTLEEVERILAHVRTLCTSKAWPRGDLNLPRAMFTEKAFPEDEAVLTLGAPLEGTPGLSTELLYGKRFGARNQIEVVVPLGFQDAEGGWTGGISDIAVGVKRAFIASLPSGSILTGAAELILPTGGEGRGAGTFVFEPFVSYGQILPADLFVQVQAAVELPFDTDVADPEGLGRIALGRTFTQGSWGRAWTPMLEVLASSELAAGSALGLDLVPQLQVSLNTRQNILANLAVRVPVGGPGARATELYFYVLWDWFDGALTEGW